MPEVWILQTHKTSWRQNKVQCTSEYFTFNEKMKKKYWNLKTCVLLSSERKLIIFYSIYLKTLGKCYCLVILNTILSYIYYILYIFQHVNRTIIFKDFRVTGPGIWQIPENNRNASIPAVRASKPQRSCFWGTGMQTQDTVHSWHMFYSDLHTSTLWGAGCFVTVVFCVFAFCFWRRAFAFGFCFEAGSSVAQMGPVLII